MGGVDDADLMEQGGARIAYKERWNWRLGRDSTLLNRSVPGRVFTPLHKMEMFDSKVIKAIDLQWSNININIQLL